MCTKWAIQRDTGSVHLYVPILMYLYVIRINYINLDIRILHTLMYQVGLCYTDSK